MTFRWIVSVTYTRGGLEFSEPWYRSNESRSEALNHVEQDWHELNDHLFPEAVDAKFSIEEIGS